MKTLKIICILFLTLLLSSCNDDDCSSDSFCVKERTLNEHLTDKTAQLIYLDSKNKYALKFYPNFPSIDEVTYCVICNQPQGIAVDDAVKFTGKLFFFNSNENFNPSVGGENYYFTKIEQIQKLNF